MTILWLLACTSGSEPATTQPAAPTPASVADEREYTCPMHPEVRQKGPGNCPICKMALEPVGGAGGGAHEAAHSAGGHMAQMAATRDKLRAELGEAYDQPVPGLEGADATRGKAVYDQACASCHGAAGKGDGVAGTGLNPPPADFTDAFHARYYSDAGRVRIIEKGSPGTAMAGFEGQLDRAQILDVYAYIATLRAGAKPAGDDHSKQH